MCCALCFCSTLIAQQDSIPKRADAMATLLNWRVIGVPTIGYTPETNWTFGLAGSWFFQCDSMARTSELSVQAKYTLENQVAAHAQTTLYFDPEKRWMMNAAMGYTYYPNLFFGIGNERKDLLQMPWHYISNIFYLSAQPQYYLTPRWSIGPAIQLRYEGMQHNALTDSVQALYPVHGFDSYFMLGLGMVVSYDSRDRIYYPTRGLFFKTRLYYYEPYLGSSYRSGWADIDFRQFVPLYKEFIFAWQFVGQCQMGTAMPFQMMPTLGGEDLQRGIRKGVWRDDVMVAVQGEFRIPIWRYFKAAVFASVGDVYSWNNWHFTTPKVGYGAGIRVALLKPAIHVRFDVAKQNYNNEWYFYFTVKEAF